MNEMIQVCWPIRLSGREGNGAVPCGLRVQDVEWAEGRSGATPLDGGRLFVMSVLGRCDWSNDEKRSDQKCPVRFSWRLAKCPVRFGWRLAKCRLAMCAPVQRPAGRSSTVMSPGSAPWPSRAAAWTTAHGVASSPGTPPGTCSVIEGLPKMEISSRGLAAPRAIVELQAGDFAAFVEGAGDLPDA